MYIKFPINTKFMFFHPSGKMGDSFMFSTDLEKVGSVWDISIKNGTNIDIISDPVIIDSPKYGKISLTKVRADIATDYHTIIKEFWIPTNCIADIIECKEINYSVN